MLWEQRTRSWSMFCALLAVTGDGTGEAVGPPRTGSGFSVNPQLALMGASDNERVARARVRKTGHVGVVAGSLPLLLADCGGSPQAGVASLGGTTTTTARSAPAGAAGGGGGGGAASAGEGAPGGGQNSVTVMMGDRKPVDMVKFAQCMRSHGVGDFPEPSSNGTITVGGTISQSPQFQAADQTCHTLLPNGGVPTAAQLAQGLDQLLKVSVCMRAHGIKDFPDPTANGIEIPIEKGMPTDLDPNNPRFQAADKACQRFGP
jgi:hypothetical protein